MSLSDRVASQIMGEIDAITKRIDGQVELLVATNKSAALISETLQKTQRDSIATAEKLIAASAEREMQKAGEATIAALAESVAATARTLAGDAATTEKANAISFATKWVLVGVITLSSVSFGLGYGVRMVADDASLEAARIKVAEANAAADAAEKEAQSRIDEYKQSMGWLGTKEGQTAKKFFAHPSGMAAATCSSPVWEVQQGADGNYCIPKRRE